MLMVVFRWIIFECFFHLTCTNFNFFKELWRPMQLIKYKNLYQYGIMASESIFLSANMSCA